MKKFLAIYLGTPAGREKWMQIPEAKRKEREQTGVKAWMDWGVANEAAAKLFENHPHFTIFPGDSVEIMECLPLPGQ